MQVVLDVVIQLLQLCPVAAMGACAAVTVPHTEHFLPSVLPSVVQVAAVPFTVTSVCPVAEMEAVSVAPHPLRVQVRFLDPAVVQVAAVVVDQLP